MVSFKLKRQAQMFVYHQTSRKGMPRAATLKCTDCEKQASDYDHYKGYERKHWLDVQPVCRSCHFKREFRRDSKKIKTLTSNNVKTCIHGVRPTIDCRECGRIAYRKWRKTNAAQDRARCLKRYYDKKAANKIL